jgi:hypothetical protein
MCIAVVFAGSPVLERVLDSVERLLGAFKVFFRLGFLLCGLLAGVGWGMSTVVGGARHRRICGPALLAYREGALELFSKLGGVGG